LRQKIKKNKTLNSKNHDITSSFFWIMLRTFGKYA